ncbi:MAG: hypothetical protein WA610_09195 [Thermodesulfovibrionales bacterium]
MLSYRYIRDYYKDPRYLPSTDHNVNAGLEYDLGTYLPRVKGRLNMGYSYYHYPDSLNNSVMFTVGFSRTLDEIWSINVDGGIRRTRSKLFISKLVPLDPTHLIVVREQIKNSGWSPTGSISLTYRGEHFSGDLSYTNDLTLGSGLNGAAYNNTLALSTKYRFTYELSALFDIGYSLYKSDTSNYTAFPSNRKSIWAGPGVRYEFSRGPLRIFSREKDVAVEASYGYTAIKDRAQGIRINRHVISVRLSMQHAFLE